MLGINLLKLHKLFLTRDFKRIYILKIKAGAAIGGTLGYGINKYIYLIVITNTCMIQQLKINSFDLNLAWGGHHGGGKHRYLKFY